jgi:hypothetical protein
MTRIVERPFPFDKLRVTPAKRLNLTSSRMIERSFAAAQDFGRRLPLPLTPPKRFNLII